MELVASPSARPVSAKQLQARINATRKMRAKSPHSSRNTPLPTSAVTASNAISSATIDYTLSCPTSNNNPLSRRTRPPRPQRLEILSRDPHGSSNSSPSIPRHPSPYQPTTQRSFRSRNPSPLSTMTTIEAVPDPPNIISTALQPKSTTINSSAIVSKKSSTALGKLPLTGHHVNPR